MSSDNTQQRIIETAGPIFAAKGFEATTVREICRRAEVNLAAVNYHFGSKEGLYVATVREAHPDRLEQRLAPEFAPGTTPAERLRGFVKVLLRRLLELNATDWQWRLLLREITDPTPMCREMLQEHFRSGFGALLAIVDEVVGPALPPHRRHQIALSVVGQCVYYRSAASIVPMIVGEEELAAHYDVEALTEHITRFSLAALGLAPPITQRLSENGDRRPDVVTGAKR
ncbi:MAG: TetR/AcrR family transcriptional regulator [Thermoguttaceae bacterium]